ncbi:MAG: hypothetical protein QW041_02940 [Candidatus Pacearchaeota archaeon]
MESEKRIYLICSRNSSKKEIQERYVRMLESLGYKVYYSQNDTNQNNKSGIETCIAKKRAMAKCTEVRAIWNPESEESIFDFGMVFMSYKPFYLVNKRRVKSWLEKHPEKSFTKVAYDLDNLSRMYNKRKL